MTDQVDSPSLAGAFPVEPKQDRARSKRDAILASAQVLFAERGYEKTNAKLIAAHAGVAIGTFYRYFTDKRQLLVALVQDRIAELLPANPEWLTGDPESALLQLLERHASRRREFRLVAALLELATREPDMADAVNEVRREAHERLVAGLRQAQAKGLTWPDLDLDGTAWAILVLVDQGCADGEPDRFPVRLRTLANLIARMVMPPGAPGCLQDGDDHGPYSLEKELCTND